MSYALEWEPLTLIGRLFGARLAAQAGEVVGKRILEAVAFAKGARATHFDLAPPELPDGARERAAALAAEIDRSPYGNGLGRTLADRVLTAMATDLLPLKPKPLARELKVPQRAAVEGCLAGVRAGLLTMKWDLLCTNCRGPKLSAGALSELPRGAHCPSCNIDYDRDFEKNVELSFAPAPSVRPLMAGGFCLSGPMATPHVAVQLLLAPGEKRSVQIDLPPGSYRLRTLHPGTHVDLEHAGGAFPGLRVTATGVEALPPGEAGTVAFANDAGFELAALIEDRTWTRDALTAPEVISLQVFRDLFAEATLRPGDEAGVSQVALLFSDLQGSTALYERVGDAVAFNMVREHFALLAGVVRDHDGAVVKTIGDAVMASFGDPANAVKAALAMQARIADPRARPEARHPCRPERGREPERPPRLFRLDREHGRPPAGPEPGRRHRALARRRRRSRGAAAAGNAGRARGKRRPERLRRPHQLRPFDALSARVIAGGEGGDPRVSAGRVRWVFESVDSDAASARYVEDLDEPLGRPVVAERIFVAELEALIRGGPAGEFPGLDKSPARRIRIEPDVEVRRPVHVDGFQGVRPGKPLAGRDVDLPPLVLGPVAPAIAQEQACPGFIDDTDDGKPGGGVGDAWRQEKRCTHAGPCQGLTTRKGRCHDFLLHEVDRPAARGGCT